MSPPRESRRRRSLAIEPMTCAPNAFVTGDGLRVLEPELNELKQLMMQEQGELRSFITALRSGPLVAFDDLAFDLEALAERLVDEMVAGGAPADLKAALGFPLPVWVICDMLGVPDTDRDRFAAWMQRNVIESSPEDFSARVEHLRKAA